MRQTRMIKINGASLEVDLDGSIYCNGSELVPTYDTKGNECVVIPLEDGTKRKRDLLRLYASVWIDDYKQSQRPYFIEGERYHPTNILQMSKNKFKEITVDGMDIGYHYKGILIVDHKYKKVVPVGDYITLNKKRYLFNDILKSIKRINITSPNGNLEIKRIPGFLNYTVSGIGQVRKDDALVSTKINEGIVVCRLERGKRSFDIPVKELISMAFKNGSRYGRVEVLDGDETNLTLKNIRAIDIRKD